MNDYRRGTQINLSVPLDSRHQAKRGGLEDRERIDFNANPRRRRRLLSGWILSWL